jgi:hypothetical protein
VGKRLQGAFGALLIMVIAAITNPSAERHRDKIRSTVAERSPVSGVLGIGALKAFTSNYHSLGVASYTDAGDKLLSWGAFGYVYVMQ